MSLDNTSKGIPVYFKQSEVKDRKKTASTILAEASLKIGQPKFDKSNKTKLIDEFMRGPFKFGMS